VKYTVDSGRISNLERVAGDAFCHLSVINKYCTSLITFRLRHESSGQNRARGRPKKNWLEGIKKAMNDRNLNEGQWEDRKQWSLGVGQRRKPF